MSATENRPQVPDPREEPLTRPGLSAVIVPLIIGGALVVGALLLWDTHTAKIRMAEMTRVEESVRADLRQAYRELRAFRPESALAITDQIREKMRSLKTIWPTDYSEMRMAYHLIRGEAGFMIDKQKNAAEAEEQFSKALESMTSASGEAWELALLGRAATRIQLQEYQRAVNDLSLLMERNPNFGAAYYWRAKARQSLGDTAGAAEDAERARNLNSWPPLRDYVYNPDGAEER